MKLNSLLAALALLAGCGAPDPDYMGRIHGTQDGGAVSGCAMGQEGRTLTYTRSITPLTDGGTLGVSRIDFNTMTWCCPRGSTFAQCPAPSLVRTTCMGGWPDAPCPSTTVFTGQNCRSDNDCGVSELCVSMPQTTDGGILLSEGVQRCLTRCTLSQGGANAPYALCSDGTSVCAPAPNQTPDSRRGVCYPVR